jgi:lysozyme
MGLAINPKTGTIEWAKEDLKRFEGYSDTGYYANDDEKARGIVTVGYGSTHRVGHGEKITEEQANQFLMEDMMEAEEAVDRLVTIDLNPNQRAALTSLVFNVGQGNFAKSKALVALNTGDFDSFKREAFGENDGFVYSGGVKLPGLVNRRSQEQDMFTGMLRLP